MPKKNLHAFTHLVHPQLSNNHRPRLLHPEWTLLMAGLAMVAVVVVTGFSRVAVSQGGYILGYATNITVDQVVAQTNQQRIASGLSPLSYDPVLSTAALAKATDMFKHQYWAHVSPTGKQPWDFIHESGYEYQAAGENLARDFYETDAMMSAWMASPTHRANIVNGKYTQIGIAVVNGTLEGTETTLVVQLFGRPVGVGSGTPQVAVAQAPTPVPNVAMVAGNSVTSFPSKETDQPSVEDTAPVTGVGVDPGTGQTTILQRVSTEPVEPENKNQVLAAFSFMT